MSNSVVTDEQMHFAQAAFAGYKVPKLSYGVVRDYCQFADVLPGLASYSMDLKDHQRCWMLKSILATFPIGSRLLEIGAGEPIVADILGRLGYHVTVVDPYEGAGNGPTAVDYFKKIYPNLEYILDLFTPGLQGVAEKSIDCCYSISVLEHIPLDQLPGVVEAMEKFTKAGGLLVHAVDCVTMGAGAEYHTEIIKTLVGLLGDTDGGVDEMLAAAHQDLETYYLSAEAHNRWRGATPYDQFPMRRCISAQISRVLT